MKNILSITGSIMTCWSLCNAAVFLGCSGTAYPINFDTTVPDVNNGRFAGTGFQSYPGMEQLDSDSWASVGWSTGYPPFSGNQVTPNTDYTPGYGVGGTATGGLYGFDVGGRNAMLGIEPGAVPRRGFAQNSFTLRLQHTIGDAINAFDANYVLYIRDDTRRSTSFDFVYSLNDSAYTSVAALNYASPAAEDTLPTWVANSRGTTSNGLTVADGSYLYLRRNAADAGGNGYTRDESALDKISITPVPEPAEWGMICAAGMLGLCGWHAWRERRRAVRPFPTL